jgi:RNA polymerase sigma factor (sigma-70 family)
MKAQTPNEFSQNAPFSDADLVRASCRGDKRAFVEIVARYQAMVCGLALGILGDFAASEDAAQEAFLTAWRQLPALREPMHLRAWLGQIARNTALGHLRRRRGYDALEEDVVAVADDSPAPDEAAATAEEAALVRASLARLPATYRLPLVLYYREGQSVRAVAETLELSEDAVKQRLARGREMLRDQLSGLVENVLTRTKPTAIFTMAVAAAIGALAAPAAVAGGVFSAATTAGATTTTSWTSSLLTAMSTSKTVLVTAALVAFVCVPVGYHLRTGAVAPTATGNLLVTPGKSPVAAANATLTFENSALFAEWRLLHERCGTNASAMPALYKAIADLNDPFRRRALHAALAAEWAQVDPAGGLKFFLGKGPDATQRRQFFEEWLARDHGAAVRALLAGGAGWENVARDCLTEIARRAPSLVPEVASRLPEAESYWYMWQTEVRDAFAVLAQSGIQPALKAAETVTGPNRDQALAGVAQVWARSDLDHVIAWAKALPDGTDRNEIIRAALLGKAGLDPAAALDLVGTVPSGGGNDFPASTTGARVLDAAAKADFDATVAWLTAHPGRFGHGDLYGLVGAVTERLNADAAGFLTAHTADNSLSALLPAVDNALLNNASGQRAAVWDWLKTQPDNEISRDLRVDVLSSAAYQEPNLTLQLVADLPRTPQGDAQVQELARCLYNGGNRLGRFDSLLPQAPERLRQPLIDAAFSCLAPDNLGDPQIWAARLSLLADTSRAQGTESLARAWAGQSPEDAAAWASSLAAGSSRTGAFGAIASAWAAKDPLGAADWVASLPLGADRNQGTQSLVVAVAGQYPREAWDWALSITDTAERSSAAAQAVKAMAARDPATARQWIESGPFSASTRAELTAALGRTAGAQR